MDKEYVQLKDVLQIMNELDVSGQPVSFHLKFVTLDRQRKTGGEIIEVHQARKFIGIRAGKMIFDTRDHYNSDKSESRNPNHWSNATRNIILPNKQLRKIHIRLIIEFNHKKVYF